MIANLRRQPEALRVDVPAFDKLLAPAQEVARHHDRLEVGGRGRDQLLQVRLGFIAAIGAVEVDGALNERDLRRLRATTMRCIRK
jgi:hypothetical protein